MWIVNNEIGKKLGLNIRSFNIKGTSYGVGFTKSSAVLYNHITNKILYQNVCIDDIGKVEVEGRNLSLNKADGSGFFFSIESNTKDIFSEELKDGDFFLVLYKNDSEEEVETIDTLEFSDN